MRARFHDLHTISMNSTEIALFTAHARARDQMRTDPGLVERAARVQRRALYTNPLRSWSLVLRANDKRIDPECLSPIVGYHEWDEDSPQCAIEAITLDAETVRKLCSPVMIPYPGVSIDEAAKRFGVNRTTIFRWSRREDVPLVMNYYCKRNGRDMHRAEKDVWTRSPIDPAGQVWTPPWDEPGRDLTMSMPENFSQVLRRTHRPTSSRCFTRFLECPQCLKWCLKLYCPRRVWTICDQTRRETEVSPHPNPLPGERGPERFLCRKCARLIYESAERTSTSAPGRPANIWDRYVKRATGCVVRGRDLKAETPKTES